MAHSNSIFFLADAVHYFIQQLVHEEPLDKFLLKLGSRKKFVSIDEYVYFFLSDKEKETM